MNNLTKNSKLIYWAKGVAGVIHPVSCDYLSLSFLYLKMHKNKATMWLPALIIAYWIMV